MYSVLIAEDELLVRMGISGSVPWTRLDMCVRAETADGLSAWEAYQKFRPDIVIADIRMPKMDGIELLRRIRGEDPDCAVIIITNVEYEETLKAARQLGVIDVLLKASMKQNDIMNAIARAKSVLERCSRAGIAAPIESGDSWKRFFCGAGEQAAYEGGVYEPEGLIVLRICPSELLSQRLEDSMQNLFAHRVRSIAEFSGTTLQMGAIALAREKFRTEEANRQLREMRRYVQDNFGVELRFVLHEGRIPLSGLRRYAEAAIDSSRRDDLFANDVLALDDQAYPTDPALARAKCELERTQLVFPSDSLLAQCGDVLREFPREAAASPAGGHEAAILLLERLGGAAQARTFPALSEELSGAILRTCSQMLRGVHPELLRALGHINGRLNERLSVQSVSRVIGYHPTYFSNLFKRETGMNFSDYLSVMRLRRAKQLMRETDLPLQEIAEACGFPDLSYFSVKFKKAEGVSPSHWRAKR